MTGWVRATALLGLSVALGCTGSGTAGNGSPAGTATTSGTSGSATGTGGTSGGQVEPRGMRQLGVDILYVTPGSPFAQSLATAQALGSGVLELALDWNQIEADTPTVCDAGGTYVDPLAALATFETLLPDAGLTLSLTLRTVNTNLLAVPASLQAGAFDGGQAETDLMACRFEKLLDYVFAQIPSVQLTSLQIGNEIEDYPAAATNVGFWSSYWSFFSQVAPYARQLRPGLKVGVTSTFPGRGGSRRPTTWPQAGLAQLNPDR